jgi:hypothetical protein
MSTGSTKEAAEAALLELPSVIGAFVREDVHGHPREVHLLIRAGPNARHLACDVRDLLEDRLGLPVDQRVISIAQLAPGRRPGPLLASIVDGAQPATAARAAAAGMVSPATSPDAEASPARPKDPRVVFTGIRTESVQNRVRIRVTMEADGIEYRGEASGLDTAPSRLRACVAAALQAIDGTCAGRARFEVEHVGVVNAFEREYIVVSALASSPWLGRRPVPLVGAHAVELDVESAAAFAALKAVNRTLGFLRRLDAPGAAGAHGRNRRS